MKKVGFIGAYDKINLIVYIAKILTLTGKKVLVIDSTVNQRAKYILPVLNPTKSYITSYQDIDVAVGFNGFDEINGYLGMSQNAFAEYDYILIDIDKPEAMDKFNMISTDLQFFVTSMDLYSLKRGLEILSGLRSTINFTKVYFTRGMPVEEDDYLNFLSLGYKIIWNEEKVYFPYETSDQLAIMENQRNSEITIRNLSAQYKSGLLYVVEQIGGHENQKEIKKVFKNLEKGVL